MGESTYEIRETTKEIYVLYSIGLSEDILPNMDRPGLSGNPQRRYTSSEEELEYILKRAKEADAGPGVGHIEVDSALIKRLKITEEELPETVTIDNFLYRSEKEHKNATSISFGEAAKLGFPRQIVIKRVDSIKAYKEKK